MRLYSVEITSEERAERGFARYLNEVLHAVEQAYMQAVVAHKNSTIKIMVSTEEPQSHD